MTEFRDFLIGMAIAVVLAAAVISGINYVQGDEVHQPEVVECSLTNPDQV